MTDKPPLVRFICFMRDYYVQDNIKTSYVTHKRQAARFIYKLHFYIKCPAFHTLRENIKSNLIHVFALNIYTNARMTCQAFHNLRENTKSNLIHVFALNRIIAAKSTHKLFSRKEISNVFLLLYSLPFVLLSFNTLSQK